MIPDPTICECERRCCYQVESDTPRLRKTIRPAPRNRSIWLRLPRELLTHPARSRVPRRHQPLATPGACHRTPHSKPLRCTALKRLLLPASRGAAQTPNTDKKKTPGEAAKNPGNSNQFLPRERAADLSWNRRAGEGDFANNLTGAAPCYLAAADPAGREAPIHRRRPARLLLSLSLSLSLSLYLSFSFPGDLISLISEA